MTYNHCNGNLQLIYDPSFLPKACDYILCKIQVNEVRMKYKNHYQTDRLSTLFLLLGLLF